jgi:hypothetical protein
MDLRVAEQLPKSIHHAIQGQSIKQGIKRQKIMFEGRLKQVENIQIITAVKRI